MSLAAPYQELYYVADGSTTSFAFGQSFTALNEIDVKSIIYFEDGTNCVPVFNVNMTTGYINIVTLTKPDGTVLTVPPAGSIVRIFRDTPEAQNVTASQLQNYTAKQLERVFDSLVAMIQEISYSDIHKTVRLTETQRDIAIDYLPDDKDQAVIYWDVEERKLMPAGFGQNQVVKSDGVEWLVYNQSEGKVYFIPRQGGNPIPIGEATIHNDLSGRNAPDCHPESAITGLREHLQELRDKDSEIEVNVDIALNRSQEAVDTAEEAKLIAEHAQSQVAQAQQTAEEAKQIAEGIDAKAQEALDNSSVALDNANEALEKIEQEKSDRQSADATLQDNIDQEALSRSNADIALQNQITANKSTMDSHIADTNNPHSVTKAQVGLGNVDNTSDLDKPISTATQSALDDLQNQVDDVSARGRFLSIWNCTTGLPETNPPESPYTYHAGDYFIVGIVGAVNYKPNGSSFTTGVASTTVETLEVKVNDTYYYDGTTWKLQANAQREYSFSGIAGSPYDNTNLSSALNSKADVSALTAHTSDTSNPHQVTKTQVGLGNVDNTSDLNKPISTATQTALNGKQATISDLATIRSNAQAGKSASDTIETYGNIVTHNVSEFATSAQGAKADTAVQPGDLATVATSGSYNDLSNKPTIPADISTHRVNGAPLSNAVSNFFGIGHTPNTTVQKEVSIPSITTLDVGTVILVKPTVTSTVANSTLKLNDFDAYPMRYNNAAITTSTDSIVWNANYPSWWVFDGTYWEFAGHGVDSNTTYTINYTLDAGRYQAGVGTYAVTRYSLLMEKADGTWEKTTNTASNYSTGTSKTVNTRGFRLNHIRYYNTTATVANGALIATNTLQNKAASVIFAYSANCSTAPGWEVGDYIYLVGTLGTDGLFYLDTTQWWANALPTTNDGKLYIRLGIALTATDSTMSFFEDRPIYYHDGTGIKEYKVADNKQDIINDLSAIRSGAALGATAVQPADLAAHRVNGASLSNSVSVFYGTSSTAADTVEKVVSVPSITTLDVGTIIVVQPSVTSTVANSTLKLNNFPAYPMRYNGAAVTTSNDYIAWNASHPCVWVFDGTHWCFVAHGVDYNTTYSVMSVAEGKAGTETSGRVLRADYLKRIIQGTTLTGIDVATTGAVSASDTITDGIGKLQATKADKSEVPTVGNGTITITQGGITKGTFTTNQSGDTTVALDAGGGGIGNIDNLTITANADDEIQAVATINANTATGATNPIYDWVGTLAEYNAQNIETAHPDWVCFITDDTTATAYEAYTKTQTDNLFVAKGHEVIEFQEPTSTNNYTWYRKYADGWVEQGGIATANGTNTISIALPIEMANTNYWGFSTLEQANTANICGQKYSTSTVTTFVTYLQQGSGKWFVCGIAA